MSYCISKNGSLLLSAPIIVIYILSASLMILVCTPQSRPPAPRHVMRKEKGFSFRALSIYPSNHPTIQPPVE